MLIFLPDCRGSNPAHLAAAGLKALLRPDDDSPSSTDLVTTGPGSLYGQTWGWLGNGGEANGYIPEGQTWVKSDSGTYWVGWQYDHTPSPITLRRKGLLPGKTVVLGDGNPWIVPSVLELPQQARRRDGKWVWESESRFSEFVERSQWAFDVARNWLESPGPVPIETIDYAIEVLSMNYRLVPEVIDRFGLLTPDTVMAVLMASTDLRRLTEIHDQLKKGAPAATQSG